MTTGIKKTGFILILLTLHFFLPVAGYSDEIEQNIPHKNLTEKLVIFQTTDIHSYFTGKECGWLNLAQMIHSEREKAGGNDKTLLIDCGDTLNGSPEAFISRGQAGVNMLNVMNYDAWIPGNHDLEFSPGKFSALRNKIKADTIAANLFFTDSSPALQKWKLYRKKGLKIAVIGLTSPYIKEWLWGRKIKHIQVKKMIDSVAHTMPDVLKNNPDFIILAVHHGLYAPPRLGGMKLARIAERFPAINLILGGHSHQLVPGEKCGPASWFVQSGCHAEYFAKIAVTFDKTTKKIKNISSELIPVTAQKKINPTFIKAGSLWMTAANALQKKNIGSTLLPVTPPDKNSFSGTMDELFRLAVAEQTDADIVFHGCVSYSAKFAGAITEKEIFAAIPYDDTVCTLLLTPDEIRKVINEQLNNRQNDKYSRFQPPLGLTAVIDKSMHVAGVTDENGTPLVPDRKYKCAFSSYILAGAGGRFPVLKKLAASAATRPEDSGVLVRDALRNYIAAHSPLNIKKVTRIIPAEKTDTKK